MAKKKKKQEEAPPGAPLYMLTYGDMVTLLLTFFVMLFTVAKIEGREFRLILSAFRGSLGLFEGGQTLSKGELEEMGMSLETLPAQEAGRNLSKALKMATEIFKPEVKVKKVQVTQDERGLVISLIGSDHFPPGSARLTSEAKRILTKVSKLLRHIPSLIRIEGHSDETPVVGGPAAEKYETNWELAGQRSINVLRYFHEVEDIEPEKMSAISYGKYRPLVSSTTPEARAINRRVDIVILPGKSYKRNYQDSDLPGKKIPGVEYTTEGYQ
ncbi:MAG: flagellar motor protein MotB [Spirochaetia bacterium]|nr:flagellar motor protein MotB [Spirochaetia bacterium]